MYDGGAWAIESNRVVRRGDEPVASIRRYPPAGFTLPPSFAMMKRLAPLLAFSLAVAPARLTAQSPALVGVWSVTFAAGMRNEGGVETPIMQSGSLKITAEGDSLVAVMTMQPPPGMPARPSSRMAALASATPAVFVLKSQARLNMNGEELTRTAISTFSLKASGDSLSGTLTRVIEGIDFPSSPMPVTGTRSKG